MQNRYVEKSHKKPRDERNYKHPKIAGSVSCSANTVFINRKDDHGILELPCHAEGDSEMEEVQKNNKGGEERGRIPDLATLENLNQT